MQFNYSNTDKVNSVVLVEKDFYIRYIEKIFDDAVRFEKVKIKKKILNFSTHHDSQAAIKISEQKKVILEIFA